jgi:hypothetical protein
MVVLLGIATPEGTFFGLKLSILLSAINPKLNVLAIGEETTSIERLFEHSQKLFSSKSHICIRHTHDHQDLFYSFKNDSKTGDRFIQSGSLINALNGNCYLANILNLNKNELNLLKETLETGKIHFKEAKRDQLKNKFININENYFHIEQCDLNCSIWAYYDLSFNKKPKTNFDITELPKPLVE